MSEDLKKLLSEATPGPWGDDCADHDAPYENIKIKADHRTICTIWIDDAPVPDFNRGQEANAELIKLAPALAARVAELAALLEEADRQLAYLDERSPSGTTPAVRAKIRAALNPTGEA